MEQSEGGPQTARRRPGRSRAGHKHSIALLQMLCGIGRSGAAGVANGMKWSERVRGQRPFMETQSSSSNVKIESVGLPK